MDSAGGGEALVFGEWRYDPSLPALSRRELAGAWRGVPLGSRALTILGMLLEQRGAVVPKERIIRTVWPSTTVEPNNLAVQIATLRRVLDDGREGDSLIQTVPGQGYRLACSVAPEGHQPVVDDPVIAAAPGRRWRLLAVGAVLLVSVCGVAVWLASGAAPTPLVATVAISFEGVDGATSGALARDLAGAVAADFNQAHLFEAPRDFVVGTGHVVSDPAVLRQSRARYVLQARLYPLDTGTRLDAQLVETQTGSQLWSQRLDIDPEHTAAARGDAIRRIESGMGPVLLATELRRRQLEQPNKTTATELVLQALLVSQLPPSPERLSKERELYERASQLDPSSFFVKGKLAILLMDGEDYNPTGFKSLLERTRGLVSDLRTTSPSSQLALRVYAQWLQWQDGRCSEAIEAARKVVDLYPDSVPPIRWLAQCLTLVGRAEEALPWAERALSFGGSSNSWQFADLRTKADVLFDLGRYKESIAWNERALGANPDIGAEARSRRLTRIASAQALEGEIEAATRTMARAQALWPYWTVRGETPFDLWSPAGPSGKLRLQEGYRLAGLRDHADEAADFGAAPTTTLQQALAGHTSLTLPGATTVRTAEVAQLLADRRVVIIDAMSRFSGRSLPGAIGLQYVGRGGSLSDSAQDSLRRTMLELTKGDLALPILAVGWNSEYFDGTNLALRLVALGYRNVLWYRGGREAWEASGGPETPLSIREW